MQSDDETLTHSHLSDTILSFSYNNHCSSQHNDILLNSIQLLPAILTHSNKWKESELEWEIEGKNMWIKIHYSLFNHPTSTFIIIIFTSSKLQLSHTYQFTHSYTINTLASSQFSQHNEWKNIITFERKFEEQLLYLRHHLYVFRYLPFHRIRLN